MSATEREKKRKKMESNSSMSGADSPQQQIVHAQIHRGTHSDTDNSSADEREDIGLRRGVNVLERAALDNLSTDEKLNLIIEKLFCLDTKVDKLSAQVSDNKKKLMDLEEKVEENTKSLASTEEKMAKMEAVLEDHANRLRRNNVVIYGVPEGAEGEDCIVFVKKLFVDHMDMPEAEDWEIERAHRSPTGPPQTGKNSRCIHIKFLRYQDRVKLLRMAPRKLKDNPYVFKGKTSRIFIADDVTTVVRQERKKLAALKKLIKGKFPERKVFIPPSVPAVLLRENSHGKLVKVILGTPIETLD